jgi:hypothetical protein
MVKLNTNFIGGLFTLAPIGELPRYGSRDEIAIDDPRELYFISEGEYKNKLEKDMKNVFTIRYLSNGVTRFLTEKVIACFDLSVFDYIIVDGRSFILCTIDDIPTIVLAIEEVVKHKIEYRVEKAVKTQ